MPDKGFLFDYYVLWLWGDLALQGGNPYDQHFLRVGLSSLGVIFNDPLVGQPPWTMWLYALFAIFPFYTARFLWGITITTSVVLFCSWCCSLFFRKRRSPGQSRLVTCLVLLLSFSPILNNIRWGQVNFVMCLGLMGFVHYKLAGNKRASGLSLSLLLFKPHLFLPLFGYIAALSLRERDFRIPLWCLAGFLIQCLMSYALTTAAFSYYPQDYLRSLDLTQIFPMPSLPLMVSHWLHLPLARTILPLSGVCAGIWIGFKQGELLLDIPLLLALSLAVAPYSWSHGYLPLLVPYLVTAGRILDCSRSLFYLVITVLAAFQYWISYDTYMSLDRLMVIIPLLLLIEHTAARYRMPRPICDTPA